MSYRLKERQIQNLIAGGELYYDGQKITVTTEMRENLRHLKRTGSTVTVYIVSCNRSFEPVYRLKIYLPGENTCDFSHGMNRYTYVD